jgi:hypothetical protein
MGLNRDGMVTFTKPWFSGTPQNAVKATGTLTLSSTPVADETITIGTEVYEAIANGGSVSDADYIAVELAATPSADTFVVALANAINTNSSIVTAVASTPDDTVALTYVSVGTEGNSVGTTETMVNGAFGAATLAGGQYATPCKAPLAMIEISGTKYYTEKPVDKWTTDGWYTVSLS